MFGPPPVCPFKPLLVECQFLMVFPQFGWGTVDSFSGVPSRVLCSSLSLSLSHTHSLKRIALSILRLYSFVGCCRYLLVFLNPFSSSNEILWCSKKSISVSSTFQPPFVKNTPCFLFSMWQVWMSWDSLFASVIGAVVGLWEVCVCVCVLMNLLKKLWESATFTLFFVHEFCPMMHVFVAIIHTGCRRKRYMPCLLLSALPPHLSWWKNMRQKV